MHIIYTYICLQYLSLCVWLFLTYEYDLKLHLFTYEWHKLREVFFRCMGKQETEGGEGKGIERKRTEKEKDENSAFANEKGGSWREWGGTGR